MSNTPAASAALPEPSAGDTREALAAEIKELVEEYLLAATGRGNAIRARARLHATIDRLAALTEQPAAPQASHLGDSVARCGSPSGAVSGGSGIGVFDAEALLADFCEASGTYFTETYRPSAKTRQVVSNPIRRDDLLMLIREARSAETQTGASVAAPQARPDQQSDSSSAAPQGVQAEPPQGLAAWLRAEAARHDTSPCRDDPAVRVHVETLRRWADELYSMPAAPAQEPQQPDPCPQRRPGVVCRTPKCGRLRAKAAASSPAPAVQPTVAVAELVEALRDMLAGWKYIRSFHGDLYGVGWDRAQEKAEAAIAKHGQPQGGKEAAQRERMAEKFANRATTQATADFDLPEPNDVVQPQGGSNA